MARPPQGQMHPGRQLAVLGLLFVVLYLLVFFVGGAEGRLRRTGCSRGSAWTWSAAPRSTYQAPDARRPGAAEGEHGGGPRHHRAAGQRASASPRPRWSSRATATSWSPSRARADDQLKDVGAGRPDAVPQGAQGRPATPAAVAAQPADGAPAPGPERQRRPEAERQRGPEAGRQRRRADGAVGVRRWPGRRRLRRRAPAPPPRRRRTAPSAGPQRRRPPRPRSPPDVAAQRAAVAQEGRRAGLGGGRRAARARRPDTDPDAGCRSSRSAS